MRSRVFYDQANGREQSKGTGVFIPRSIQPRRKSKHGKFSNSSNTKAHQNLQSCDNSKGVSQNHLPSSTYTSFNHKRIT